MNFDLAKFYKFCAELKIETKEEGLKKMPGDSKGALLRMFIL